LGPLKAKDDLDDILDLDDDLLQLDDEVESVRALTLKDDYDYEDTDFMTKQNNNVPSYPAGFAPEDDLDGDGKIDEIEATLKVNTVKADLRDHLDENVRSAYLAKFRKEVDFHHKVAYRYEKAYRLGKKQPQKK
tara:strand:- start:39 stop:440 length:402 start_codon:yes stop_codon:yes gene_type:complete